MALKNISILLFLNAIHRHFWLIFSLRFHVQLTSRSQILRYYDLKHRSFKYNLLVTSEELTPLYDVPFACSTFVEGQGSRSQATIPHMTRIWNFLSFKLYESLQKTKTSTFLLSSRGIYRRACKLMEYHRRILCHTIRSRKCKLGSVLCRTSDRPSHLRWINDVGFSAMTFCRMTHLGNCHCGPCC